MRKMKNLNNMKKTVLKLEKEISAISDNLSKVKNKDHTTMKKIINNINYLLTKESPALYNNHPKLKNINDFKHINETEENHKIEENQITKSNKHIHIKNDTNLLIPIKQAKNRNNSNSNEQFFNKKSFSSSKIYNNKTISAGKAKNYYKQINDFYNNINRNNIIDYTNNQMLNKGNQMTYSKPRLINEKMNLKTNCNKNNNKIFTHTNATNTTANNLIINSINNLNINNNNLSIQNERTKNIPDSDLQYLDLNNKNNKGNNEENNNKKKSSELDLDLYYNYDTSQAKIFSNENSDYNNINKFIIENKNENIEKRRNMNEKEEKKVNEKEENENERKSEKDILYNMKKKEIIK